MADIIEARGLQAVEIVPTEDKNVVVLVLTDIDQKSSSFAINAQGLGILLAEGCRSNVNMSG